MAQRIKGDAIGRSTIHETILVLNAGSSSIKFSLFAESGVAATELVLRGQVEGLYTRAKFAATDTSGARIGGKDWGKGAKLHHDGAVAYLLDWLKQQLGASRPVSAVGHRVVHGGPDFAAPARIDADVVARLDKLVPLAPLHQPHNLALIKILQTGLFMGTRCGAIDPGVLLYLIDEQGMDARAIENLLYHQSGLLGVSGLSSDMRALEASDDPRAKAAIELLVYRMGRELGSLAAALGGLDAIVFTAGIGEKSVLIRERVCRDAAWLGVKFDAEANQAAGPCIRRTSSAVFAWVIATDEELMIARHTRATLSGAAPASSL